MPQFPAIKCLDLLTWNFMQLELSCSNFNHLLLVDLPRQVAVLS